MNLRSEEGLEQFVAANRGNVAFLRFKRGGLKQGRYSDWDIAVRERAPAMTTCRDLYGEAWLRIPRQYVVQHYYEWGQCDLLPVFEWNGFEYLDQSLFWDKVEMGEDGIPRPALGHDAYIAWMTGLLWGRRFDRRYKDFIRYAAREDEENFRECINRAFGCGLGEKLYRIALRGDAAVATHWVRQMRFKLMTGTLAGAPFATAGNVCRHWWCEWHFHRHLPFPWIGLLGPDGSGKSTVIEKLNQRIRLSRLKISVVHWLPTLQPLVSSSHGTVSDPHAQKAKPAFMSLLQLGKIFLYWWIASFRYLFHLRAKREMVLSDRFYLDLLADPKRYRYGASMGIARYIFKFLPRPDRVIILIASAKTILSRKREVAEEELEDQLDRYQEIVKKCPDRAVLVDCEREPGQVVDDVLDLLLQELKKRSR